MQVVFDQAVQLDVNAMTLALYTITSVSPAHQTRGMGLLPTLVSGQQRRQQTWTVTFSGAKHRTPAPTPFASLVDGVYDFPMSTPPRSNPAGNTAVNMAAS